MVLNQYHTSGLQIVGWIAQVAAITLLILLARHSSESLAPRRCSLSQCALAVCAAWVWRAAYAFVLASTGLHYVIADDAARFLLSWEWYRQPYLITWDGIWPAGVFYMHGAAMHVIRDPLAATKFVSVACNLLALLGVFLFTAGVYRDRRLATLTVLFSAPWWIGILLGTGTMSETPLVGFLLGGAGLFLLGLSASPQRQLLTWLVAAVCFAAATSVHMAAWTVLAAILPVLLVYALISQRAGGNFRLKTWMWFTAVSVSYCIVWLIGCWVRFGSPFEPMQRYRALLVRDSGISSMQDRVLAYPEALLMSLWGLLPLVAFGIIWGVVRNGPDRARIRISLSTAGLAFLILIGSAALGNPAGQAYRPVTSFAMALAPVALAPLVALLSSASGNGRARRLRLVAIALVALIGAFWTWDNHERTMHIHEQARDADSDAIAVGTWLRSELTRPELLQLGGGSPPVRVWTDNYLKNLAIFYACGLPGRLSEWKGKEDPGLDSMEDSQLLVTNRHVQDGRLTFEFKMARYNVYRFRKPMPDDAYVAAISPKCLVCPSAPGSKLEILVTVTNLSEHRWVDDISLSARFVQTGDGVALSGFDNRFPIGAVGPHESKQYTIQITAPARSGRYRLELDLVQEMIAWFSTKGSHRGELLIQVAGP